MNGADGHSEARVMSQGRVIGHIRITWGERCPKDRDWRKLAIGKLAEILGGWADFQSMTQEGKEDADG